MSTLTLSLYGDFTTLLKLGVLMKQKKEFSKRSLQVLQPFLKATFNAGWEIELLMTMHHDTSRSFSASELAQKVQTDLSLVIQSLSKLGRAGLIAKNADGSGFIYSPETSEKSALVELMVKAFSQRKLQVIRLLYE